MCCKENKINAPPNGWHNISLQTASSGSSISYVTPLQGISDPTEGCMGEQASLDCHDHCPAPFSYFVWQKGYFHPGSPLLCVFCPLSFSYYHCYITPSSID